MTFRITGLSPEPFRHLFGLDEESLRAAGARRCVATQSPGYPDRVEMRDVEAGETLLLVNFTHLPDDSPYRASHAIFVREGAETAFESVGQVPDVLRRRTISLRAFDADAMMVDAELVPGEDLQPAIERMLALPEVSFLHAHYATRGCYAARIDRA